jgi:hypothetical protein
LLSNANCTAATRLGQSPRNTVVAQVIYRLELAEVRLYKLNPVDPERKSAWL